MPKINSLLPEDIQKKTENDNGLSFIVDLIKKYNIIDCNNSGENLFTIYINNTCNINYKVFIMFLEKQYKLQANKIEPGRWDELIIMLSDNNKIKDLPSYLEYYFPFFYLFLPTKYKKQLFDIFYKINDDLIIDKSNNCFFHKIDFGNALEIKKYLFDLETIIIKLFVDKKLNNNLLIDLIGIDSYINFSDNIEKPLRFFHELNGFKNYTLYDENYSDFLFNTEEYLNTLHIKILNGVLNYELSFLNQEDNSLIKI